MIKSTLITHIPAMVMTFAIHVLPLNLFAISIAFLKRIANSSPCLIRVDPCFIRGYVRRIGCGRRPRWVCSVAKTPSLSGESAMAFRKMH